MKTLPLPDAKLREHGIAATDSPEFPPRCLGKYEYVDALGSGGIGDVYCYREPELGNRKVAIKFFSRGTRESNAVFLEEARVAARFRHPNVVRVHGVDEWDGIPYIVYEYIDGDDLDDVEPADWREVRSIGLQLASGLAAVHRQGILHRDIKPANAILSRDGQEVSVTLIDFGTQTSGTPAYWAPEVARAGHSRASDVYSLGLVLYKLCTGDKPDAPITSDWYEDFPAIDPAFAAVVSRCLGPDPDERYPSGEALRHALEPIYSMNELLRQAASQWELNQRARDYLWRKDQLARAEGVKSGPLPASHREFIVASQRAFNRSRLVKLGSAAIVLVGVGAAYGIAHEIRDRDIAVRVKAHTTAADQAFVAGHQRHMQFDRQRSQALAAFRAEQVALGNESWTRAMKQEPHIAQLYRQANQEQEVALNLDPERDDVRARLGDILESRLRFADDTFRHDLRDELLNRLLLHDKQRHAAWTAAIPVTLTAHPDGAVISIWRVNREPDGKLTEQQIEYDNSGIVALLPGSYRAIAAPDAEFSKVHYPFVVRHKMAPLTLALERPRRDDVPDGLVYVPPGSFYYGYGTRAEHEQVRTFYDTVPLHQRTIAGFFISRTETTFGQWIEFLNDTCTEPGCADAPELIPQGGWSDTVFVALEWSAQAEWTLHFQNGERYSSSGDYLIHGARGADQRRRQRWRKFPVSGISLLAARRYTQWLARRIPGARLCTEYEWERAARGADWRIFPHGDAFEPHEGNYDRTYGPESAQTAGLDEAGTYPQSASPFDILDMTGNVMELTDSRYLPDGRDHAREQDPDEADEDRLYTLRGGSFYTALITGAVVNRWSVSEQASYAFTGLRVCANAPN